VSVLLAYRLERASEPNGSRVKTMMLLSFVPDQRLTELSGYDKTRWFFEDGWLVLEAF
jgi:hypothetical protein